MKRITTIFLIFCCPYLALYVQNEQNSQLTSMTWDTSYVLDSISDVITGNEAAGYRTDNSLIFRMNIPLFIKRADSIIVVYDDFPKKSSFRQATVYSSRSRIVEMTIVSSQLDTPDDMPYAMYISYLDDEDFVHEVYPTPENASILRKFSGVLITPEKYPNAKVLD